MHTHKTLMRTTYHRYICTDASEIALHAVLDLKITLKNDLGMGAAVKEVPEFARWALPPTVSPPRRSQGRSAAV